MTKDERIEIPLSKTKLTFMLLGSIAFVALGIWFVTSPNDLKTTYSAQNPILVFGVGLASLIFFGLCLIYLAKKLPDSSPGLTIDAKGIYDNSSGVSAGLIVWDDIVRLQIENVVNQKFIMVIVSNPEKYIDRQKSSLKKMAMGRNYKSYGSPISISANGLKMTFDDLYRLIEREVENRSDLKTTNR